MQLENTTAAADIDIVEGQDGFQTGQVFTIAAGHFVHDSYSAFVAPLLPLLQDKLSTNYALTGGLTVFAQLPSLLNPFIGYLADKVSLRYFIILAPGITATLMGFLGLTTSYLALAILLFAAGISIATFHAPAPAMIGRLAGDRVGKGMSIFMASGELGRTLGPVLVIAAVGWFGLEGIWRLALGGWAASGLLYFRLHKVSARPADQKGGAMADVWPVVRTVFPVLIWITLSRIFMMASLTTFLPIFVTDVMEGSLWLSAASLSLLEAAGVAGALFTGTLSDRWGRAKVLGILLTLAPALLLVFLYSPSWLAIPMLFALGLTAISPTPVLLAIVQDQFPDNRALGNGILLALNFTIRAIGVWAVGLFADQAGLFQAFLWSAAIGFLGIPAVRYLPKKRQPVA